MNNDQHKNKAETKTIIEALEDISEKLENINESIDCAGVIAPVFWMQSDLAAIDKAKELGIEMLPEYSMADLRYLIDCVLGEVL